MSSSRVDWQPLDNVESESIPGHSHSSPPPHDHPQHYAPPRRNSFPDIIARRPTSLLGKLVKLLTALVMALPILLVLGLVGMAYYAYVFVFSKSRLTTGSAGQAAWAYIGSVLFTVIIALLLISYFKCVLTKSDVVTNPPPSSMDLEHLRECQKCQNYKPTRAHHCSMCNSCVLKMDHHCPWVANCVAYYNYKFFILFLFYCALGCVFFIVGSADRIFVVLFAENQNSFVSLFASIIVLAFGFTLVPFVSFHIHLALVNQTTLEYGYFPANTNPYDLGKRANFEEVFGKDPWLWLLPIQTVENTGWHYPDPDRRLMDNSPNPARVDA